MLIIFIFRLSVKQHREIQDLLKLTTYTILNSTMCCFILIYIFIVIFYFICIHIHSYCLQVANMILETIYKALYNIISRREHERSLNKWMIDKQQRVDTIVHNMRLRGEPEENIQDVRIFC